MRIYVPGVRSSASCLPAIGAWPFPLGVKAWEKNGPTVCDGVWDDMASGLQRGCSRPAQDDIELEAQGPFGL